MSETVHHCLSIAIVVNSLLFGFLWAREVWRVMIAGYESGTTRYEPSRFTAFMAALTVFTCIGTAGPRVSDWMLGPWKDTKGEVVVVPAWYGVTVRNIP